MSTRLLTIGYQMRSLDEFVDLLVEANVGVLIDVRETPWSHKPGFSKTRLAASLGASGIKYVHARFAGNPKWLRNRATTHEECLDNYRLYLSEHPEILDEFDQLMRRERLPDRAIAISCFERHPHDCHRAILADHWRRRGRRAVEHIAFEGCKRLIEA